MSQSFPILSWLDGERVEGEEVREKGCVAAVDSGEGEGSEQRELERRLERLAAVGREPVGEEVKSKKLLEGKMYSLQQVVQCVTVALCVLQELISQLTLLSMTIRLWARSHVSPTGPWGLILPHPPTSLSSLLPSGLLSESSHTSQRVQEHIETLRRELLH